MIADCDCTPAQRRHPGHSAFHAALHELLASNVIEVVGVDDHGKTVYRRVPREEQRGKVARANEFRG
jgi:hypothetical protein